MAKQVFNTKKSYKIVLKSTIREYDQIVMVETELGLLTIKGENIRINKLSLDTSEIIVEGEIDSLTYSNKDLDKKERWGIVRKNF